MENNKNILFADDEEKIRQVVTMYLKREGYQTETAVDGAEALRLFHQKNWDLIILDVMMPKMDGIKVCQEIRKTSAVPVIMLTARNDEIDRVLGLEMGADDYMGKPFSPRELVARVKAVLRRTGAAEKTAQTTLRLPGMAVNLITRKVTVLDQEIHLTPKEFDLLVLLARQPGRAFTREQLLENVWGIDYYGDLRTVDTHVKRLREKLRVTGAPSYINTVWGVGYKLEVKE
ncbi:two-component system response regulator ResD [Desulfohalotomaculum tongense]|uniref:response regulator transcription factor n=1 Tax=Desulforadius tongensis TaxID=1216062 RepID=UPI00195EE8A9|nr:response regulator transcription factor [Desulforadius tongensis]MBM7853928.1 two-component system response regulator ResD [Desulforadius tongensis]